MDSLEESKRLAREKIRQSLPDRQWLWDGIRANDKVRIGKAITLMESTLPDHRELAQALLNDCLPYSGKSLRIGITGVPGVGKSTFINCYAKLLVEKGHQVAILAVDPSSKQTGGSILGDKTRMEDIFADPKVLIRPSPAGETLGGVTARTRESILLCEAAGYDRILVETVGVGQSETSVHGMTDLFLLLMLPGAGDELQGIKRGIMEMADILVVHKSDGSNMEKSAAAMNGYKKALHLFPPTESGWTPRVIAASSMENRGIAEVHELIEQYYLHTVSNGYFAEQRKNQLKEWFQMALEMQFLSYIKEHPELQVQLDEIRRAVAEGKASPSKSAEDFVKRLLDRDATR